MHCYQCGGPHPVYACKRANEVGYTARNPLAPRVPGRPPTPAYLEAKARLKVATSDGEAAPRRLHGPELARWQVREARASRGPDVGAWIAAAEARRPAPRSRAAA